MSKKQSRSKDERNLRRKVLAGRKPGESFSQAKKRLLEEHQRQQPSAHSDSWFFRLGLLAPHQAGITSFYVQQGGKDVCSTCGDTPSRHYRPENDRSGITVRLCDDCVVIRRGMYREIWIEVGRSQVDNSGVGSPESAGPEEGPDVSEEQIAAMIASIELADPATMASETSIGALAEMPRPVREKVMQAVRTVMKFSLPSRRRARVLPTDPAKVPVSEVAHWDSDSLNMFLDRIRTRAATTTPIRHARQDSHPGTAYCGVVIDDRSATGVAPATLIKLISEAGHAAIGTLLCAQCAALVSRELQEMFDSEDDA